ncbi:MAG: hypothetical protein O3A63_21440, partial [Proteobacteria bacterium]|nr:hypothetical protein [Pseudomonadota bacterium]
MIKQPDAPKTLLPLALSILLSACSGSNAGQNLVSAEALIDAFYTFNPTELEPFLSKAPGSAAKIIFYQGWAQGGNYRIVDRQPCKALSAQVISCSITVQDDPVLALNIDFNVTDTFEHIQRRPTPVDCARAMTEGYRRFALSDAYVPQQTE